MKIPTAFHLFCAFGVSLMTLANSAVAESADEKAFKKDRAAILAMVGKFKVTFNFHETYAIKKDYPIKTKAYQESAHEIIKVVEDTGNRIVLQHLLQVEQGLEDIVIKHWGQVWTYEDAEILEYQHGTTWNKKGLSKDEAKGTWSQRVTQTDDSPRYESYGKWDHSGNSSVWISQSTPRPLPRREYTKRKDYDVLMAVNTHAISANGWVHEQTNRKLVKRDGKEEFLCSERGFNTYEKCDDHDFTAAEEYWTASSAFWENVRLFWDKEIQTANSLTYKRKVDTTSLGKAIRSMAPNGEKKTISSTEEISTIVEPYLVR